MLIRVSEYTYSITVYEKMSTVNMCGKIQYSNSLGIHSVNKKPNIFSNLCALIEEGGGERRAALVVQLPGVRAEVHEERDARETSACGRVMQCRTPLQVHLLDVRSAY